MTSRFFFLLVVFVAFELVHTFRLQSSMVRTLRIETKMISIDWEQSPDSEDGMRYAHDEITCNIYQLPLPHNAI